MPKKLLPSSDASNLSPSTTTSSFKTPRHDDSFAGKGVRLTFSRGRNRCSEKPFETTILSRKYRKSRHTPQTHCHSIECFNLPRQNVFPHATRRVVLAGSSFRFHD
ncbi:hypothetical protein E1B28_004985 [Marasmius oreades]|uniref:Uncharacterized protein n=1 Tax=Marasmius oreades TaxID=181124 RepID=A0A9P7UZT3_9AGAR|nr:uncharacterized protein E1B28_004985 [Marasmius oreades]KAG7097657.1 hypothetical protein E1B28_004985 [Marasmius oreades]